MAYNKLLCLHCLGLAFVWRIFLVVFMAKIILERTTLVKNNLIKFELRYYFA